MYASQLGVFRSKSRCQLKPWYLCQRCARHTAEPSRSVISTASSTCCVWCAASGTARVNTTSQSRLNAVYISRILSSFSSAFRFYQEGIARSAACLRAFASRLLSVAIDKMILASFSRVARTLSGSVPTLGARLAHASSNACPTTLRASGPSEAPSMT